MNSHNKIITKWQIMFLSIELSQKGNPGFGYMSVL